jgi:hypothetical protein
MNKYTYYKCRSSAFGDVCNFIAWVIGDMSDEIEYEIGQINIEETKINTILHNNTDCGVEWEFKSLMSLHDLIKLFIKAENNEIDGMHIIYETLSPIETYTSEKDD